MDDRIVFDVCGQFYAIPFENIENGPSSRLKKMCKAESFGSVIINRPPECFSAILAFYQTGELHMPMTACPGAFMSELEYWEIPQNVVSHCCYNRLKGFMDEQDTLRSFQESLTGDKSSGASYRFFKKFRARLWQIVDYKKHSIIGKIYFSTTVFMVLMSIFALAYSTDPSFQRAMTNCERLEYMASTDKEGYDIIKPYLEEHCTDDYLPDNSTDAIERGNATETFQLVDEEDDNGEDQFKSYLFQFVHQRWKKVNRTRSKRELNRQPFDVSSNETIPLIEDDSEDFNESFDMYPLDNETNNWNTSFHSNMTRNRGIRLRYPDVHVLELFSETKHVKVPNLKIRLFILVILEYMTTAYFTVDIVLRLSSCPHVRLYFFSIINCADALSLIGAYLYFALYYLFPELRYGSWIDYLSYVQMLRSLRLFRIVSHVRAGKVLAYSTRKNVKDLFILVLFLIAGMCTFAGLFYVAEDKSTVESIPDAWYWAVITMTTVGYGDIKPQTNMGRALACICAIVGVILLALTVPIFANHFLILYQHCESENVVKKIQQRSRRRPVEFKEKAVDEKKKLEAYYMK